MLSIEEKISFIKENRNLVNEYDIDKIFKHAYLKLLSNTIGIIVESTVDIKRNSIKIDFEDSIQNNIQKIKNEVESLNIDFELYKIYDKISWVFKYKYFRKADSHFTISNDSLTDLIYFMRYVITGKVDSNLEISHKIMGSNNLRYDSSKYDITIDNVNIKKLLNGKLYIKNLNEVQTNRMNAMFDIYDRLR